MQCTVFSMQCNFCYHAVYSFQYTMHSFQYALYRGGGEGGGGGRGMNNLSKIRLPCSNRLVSRMLQIFWRKTDTNSLK